MLNSDLSGKGESNNCKLFKHHLKSEKGGIKILSWLVGERVLGAKWRQPPGIQQVLVSFHRKGSAAWKEVNLQIQIFPSRSDCRMRKEAVTPTGFGVKTVRNVVCKRKTEGAFMLRSLLLNNPWWLSLGCPVPLGSTYTLSCPPGAEGSWGWEATYNYLWGRLL